jgi:hypothetical protein
MPGAPASLTRCGGVNLTRICGEDLGQDTKRLRIERQDMQIGKYGRLQCALK